MTTHITQRSAPTHREIGSDFLLAFAAGRALQASQASLCHARLCWREPSPSRTCLQLSHSCAPVSLRPIDGIAIHKDTREVAKGQMVVLRALEPEVEGARRVPAVGTRWPLRPRIATPGSRGLPSREQAHEPKRCIACSIWHRTRHPQRSLPPERSYPLAYVRRRRLLREGSSCQWSITALKSTLSASKVSLGHRWMTPRNSCKRLCSHSMPRSVRA